MSFEGHPALRKCALSIAYDNGQINRTTTEQKHLDERWKVLCSAKTVAHADIEHAERVAATWSDEELENVCQGEHGVDWPDNIKPGDTTDKVLNIIFDGE